MRGQVAPLIEARGMAVRQGAAEVLRDVDFAIRPREIVTVVGPNGSGKSTLLRALIGALKPVRGRVTRQPDLRLGYVPQGLKIDPSLPMTAARFMSLPQRVPAAEIAAALDEAGAGDLGGRQMAALSGGQFQRVLLARALLAQPQLLILDEPTTGLDQPGQASFYLRLEHLRDRLGCAVLMVSHELHVVMSASDRVICLNGHVCCEGLPEVVAQAEEYRALFGTGTQGALALYRHEHTHRHDHNHSHDHAHVHAPAEPPHAG
ncbi:ATP-binding cassette domain-containing protein [Maliponia aquimaris]